jgi:anti-sigma regulatory factor (Ser/Thr protein kinase)/ActR/RegA family two-component response regulator
MMSPQAIIIGGDAQVRSKISKILRSSQWNAQEAADNAVALKLASAGRFDLIVTCEKTSSQEDVELLRTIRRINPHTRMIILTGKATPTDVISAMREHAFACFSAPFSTDSLAGIIRHAIEEPCWDDGIEILSATPDWVVLKARCDMKTAERLLLFFDEIIELPGEEKQAVALAFRELLMNAIEHGGKFDPEQYVEISYLRTRRAVSCRIKDPGDGFTLAKLPQSAVNNPPDEPLRHLTYREAESMRPGGFGVLLVKNSIDELFYNEKGNEVVLVKYIDKVTHATP